MILVIVVPVSLGIVVDVGDVNVDVVDGDMAHMCLLQIHVRCIDAVAAFVVDAVVAVVAEQGPWPG